MEKIEKKIAMLYSNINKRADSESAYSDKNESDWEDEVIIGIDNNSNKKKRAKHKKDRDAQENEAITHNSLNKKEKLSKKNNSNMLKSKQKSKITVEEKIRRQKRRIIKKISTFLFLLILTLGAIVLLFLSPAFNIKSIEVINNNIISSEQIINLSGLSTNENILKFSKKETKNNIILNPYIEDVEIKTNMFSGNVQIDVKERIPTLMLEYGNSYVYINNQGYILEISTEPISSPIIKGYTTPLEDIKPGNRLNKDDLERLETVLKILETANSNNIGNLITHIDIKNSKNYVVILESEDKTVYLGNCMDLSTQILYIKEMLEREKGIEGEFFVDMDLNTSNPVFREKV